MRDRVYMPETILDHLDELQAYGGGILAKQYRAYTTMRPAPPQKQFLIVAHWLATKGESFAGLKCTHYNVGTGPHTRPCWGRMGECPRMAMLSNCCMVGLRVEIAKTSPESHSHLAEVQGGQQERWLAFLPYHAFLA